MEEEPLVWATFSLVGHAGRDKLQRTYHRIIEDQLGTSQEALCGVAPCCGTTWVQPEVPLPSKVLCLNCSRIEGKERGPKRATIKSRLRKLQLLKGGLRHDAVLESAKGSANLLIRALADALKEEIEAHDRTRDHRNENSRKASALQSAVNGLEGKVKRLEAELETARRATSAAQEYAAGYAEGISSIKTAIEELLAVIGSP